MDKINWLSLLLASLTPITIGFIYYKVIFRNTWLDLIGIADEKRRNRILIIISTLSIIFSFLLSFFFLNFNNSGINQEGDFDTFLHGAWHGIFVAITVLAPVIVTNGLFGRKLWKNMLINILYWIITLALMGGILDAMNHWKNIVLPTG